VWAVNAGFQNDQTEWAIRHNIEAGDIQKGATPTYEQMVDETIAADALKRLGGRAEIGQCRL